MAAYAAAVSLENTINRILRSSHTRGPPSGKFLELMYKKLITRGHPSRKFLNRANMKLEALREILGRLDSTSKSKSRKKVNALDEQIKEVLWKFEDLLESHLSDHILSQIESSDLLSGLRHEVDSFIEKVKHMEKQYIHELDNMPEDDEEEEDKEGEEESVSLIGSSDVFQEVRKGLIRDLYFTHYEDKKIYSSFVGMPGIGKTAVAKKLFEDPSILGHFDYRAWVRVGRKSGFGKIALEILDKVDPNSNMIREGDDKKIGEKLKERLKGKKCLIVLDDVWDTQVMNSLRSCLPDVQNDKVQILLTTRLRSVAEDRNRFVYAMSNEIQLLNEEESKELFREKVFGEEMIPHELEEAAEKIVKNCEGLPLLILTVAGLLSNAEKTTEYWNEVAQKRNSVFTDAYDKISKVFLPTYEYLPQHLKMLFLYIGALPQDYEMPTSKLVNILTADGFTNCIDKYLDELSDDYYLVISQRRPYYLYHRMKTCRLHSSWLHLCHGEASKTKFIQVLKSPFDDLKSQRRLCVQNNVFFSIKQVYDSMKCDWASTARSLLCFGPYHQYPVLPTNVGFKLLGTLNALTLRVYTFPIELLELVLLRYLALVYNGKLPNSISKLCNLEILIIHPHMRIKDCTSPSCVPVQMWDMQELKHIEILGSNLPIPNCDTSLRNLSTLVGVSCTVEVLKRIPSIKKLCIQIELVPYDDGSNYPSSFFDHISELKKLRTLKCSFVNPAVKYGVAPLAHVPIMFPSSLLKLHLSGLGYPWKYVNVIGSLPNLQILKLRAYAFQGPKWEPEEGSFLSLEYLLIEDTDLVQWKPSPGSFPKLCDLVLKHCYKLQEFNCLIQNVIGKSIEIVDCNPLAVTCAATCAATLAVHGLYPLTVTIRSSFEDGDR